MHEVSIIFSIVILYFILVNGKTHNDCGVLVKSSCEDTITTKWNRKNVGKNLKSWFESLRPGNKSNCFQNKRLQMERQSRVIRYIANFDCNLNHSIGPAWQTAGTISRSQFRDGFLYGIQNMDAEMTGILVYLVNQKCLT